MTKVTLMNEDMIMAKIFDIRGLLVRKVLKEYLAAAHRSNVPVNELMDSFGEILSLAQAEKGPMSEQVRENRLQENKDLSQNWVEVLPETGEPLNGYVVTVEEYSTSRVYVQARNHDEADIIAYARHKAGESVPVKSNVSVVLVSADNS